MLFLEYGLSLPIDIIDIISDDKTSLKSADFVVRRLLRSGINYLFMRLAIFTKVFMADRIGLFENMFWTE